MLGVYSEKVACLTGTSGRSWWILPSSSCDSRKTIKTHCMLYSGGTWLILHAWRLQAHFKAPLPTCLHTCPLHCHAHQFRALSPKYKVGAVVGSSDHIVWCYVFTLWLLDSTSLGNHTIWGFYKAGTLHQMSYKTSDEKYSYPSFVCAKTFEVSCSNLMFLSQQFHPFFAENCLLI